MRSDCLRPSVDDGHGSSVVHILRSYYGEPLSRKVEICSTLPQFLKLARHLSTAKDV